MSNSDDPFRPDPTTMRPRPGGGKRTSIGGTRHAARAPVTPEAEPLSPVARGALAHGLNPLVRTASPLLLLAGQVRDTTAHMDVAALRRHARDEIRRFEEQARAAGVASETILGAQYALCCGIDEAVLSTPWGSHSEWAQHPLLVELHREAWGGEKFFDMVERMSKDPARHLDLLELQYLLIALGFEGKYRAQPRGSEELQDVQRELYRLLRQRRGGATERSLSLRWRGLEDRRNPLVRYVPWWLVALAALPVLALTFTAYYWSLVSRAQPVKDALVPVSLDRPVPAAVPITGPTLKQLLSPQEQQGLLSVQERGPETTITLRASDLFSSGSTEVNPAHIGLFHQITAALNKVQGAVQVIGHTDNQPPRHSDNQELSSERAGAVVRLLSDGIDNRGRLTAVGVGDSRPLVAGSDPASRALNRRVEIVHVRGT